MGLVFMRKILTGLIVLSLLLLLVSAVPVAKAEKPLVVVVAHGLLEEDIQLTYMMGNITEVEWKVIMETITYEDIKDADMLIYVQVDTGIEITDEELAAIKKWFDQGGKTLWVTGDSDYKGGDYLRIPNTNKILEAVGSVLRNDHTEAVDRVSNCGASYRVAALIKPDPELAFLGVGVGKPVLFHGPGIVALYVNGEWKPLYGVGDKPVENVYRIAITSEGGAIAEFVEPLPHAYEVGEEGVFTLMAAEFMDNDNIVILSVEAPFDHYRGMWTTEYHEVELDGPAFVKNIVLWGVGLYGERIPEVLKLRKQVSTLEEKVSSLESELESVKSERDTLASELDKAKSRISELEGQVSELQSELEAVKGAQPTYLGGGLVVGLIIGLAIGYFVGRRK